MIGENTPILALKGVLHFDLFVFWGDFCLIRGEMLKHILNECLLDIDKTFHVTKTTLFGLILPSYCFFYLYYGRCWPTCFPPFLAQAPHPESDSVGAVPFLMYNLANYKHENTGAGLSYSGRNG
jgi:hypothetical protein